MRARESLTVPVSELIDEPIPSFFVRALRPARDGKPNRYRDSGKS
jgi:hypothetical protein